MSTRFAAGTIRLVLSIAILVAMSSGRILAATILVPAEQPTIQAGIDAAIDGDTVEVSPGTYVETIDFLGKAIRVVAPMGATIDGSAGTGVTFRSGETPSSILEGFTIVNGPGTVFVNVTFGGGVLCFKASPTILRNTLTGNSADFGSGMAILGGASPQVVENLFDQNGGDFPGATSGGAIYIEGASDAWIVRNEFHANGCTRWGSAIACVDGANVTIEDNDFVENISSGFSLAGGAVAALGSAPRVLDNTFDRNHADFFGGAVALRDSFATVRGNVMTSNTAGVAGGAIHCAGKGSPLLESNRIERGSSATGGGIACDEGVSVSIRSNVLLENGAVSNNGRGGLGGAIAIVAREATVELNTVQSNSADQRGGGIAAEESTLSMRRNRIESNRSSFFGGGVFLKASESLLRRNRIDGNTAPNGAGISSSDSTLLLESSFVTRNTADRSGGGALIDRTDFLLTNSTIADNMAGTSGGGIQTGGTAGLRIITNAILWNNEAPTGAEIFDGAADTVVSTSVVRGGWPGDSNLAADPLFVRDTEGDYRIRFGSPCIDAGDPNAQEIGTEDAEGDARILDGDFDDQAQIDIGADELRVEVAARFGTVNVAAGPLADVFLVNGSAGDDTREVHVPVSQPIRLEMVAPPAGPEPAKFVLYAFLEQPDPATVSAQPFGLGFATFPTPLNRGLPQQVAAIWNNLGVEHRLGTPDFPSKPAPSTPADLPQGVGFAVDVTFQGFIEDAASGAAGPASLTNAVVLRVGG